MLLAFVTPPYDIVVVAEHGGLVIALSLGLVAQRPSPGMILTFAFMDFLQNICNFFLVKTTSVGAVERTMI